MLREPPAQVQAFVTAYEKSPQDAGLLVFSLGFELYRSRRVRVLNAVTPRLSTARYGDSETRW
jgi:hypothetical protein